MNLTTAGTDEQLELHFECQYALVPVRRNGGPLSPSVPMARLDGMILKPTNGVVALSPNLNALFLNYKGTLMARSASGRIVLIPPRSLVFLRGGSRLTVQAARGEHTGLAMTWNAANSPILENWVQSRSKSKNGDERFIASRPIDPNFTFLVYKLEQLIEGPHDLVEPLLMSVIHEAVGELFSSPDELQLAPVPLGLNEAIYDLIREVRINPAASWPLKEASERVGYSPFHFSRVFKSMVGYGFHEYVDRCRTEIAVEMLVNSSRPVDIIASTAGFGTTQGLRESVKEYLGLVPSELRNLPEPAPLA